MSRQTVLSTAMAIAALGLVACGSGGDDNPKPSSATVQVGDTIALTASGRLISFNSATPGTQVGSVAIAGLAASETLVGIDVRPADGKLYGLGRAGNACTVKPSTGASTLKGALKALAGDDNPYASLTGANTAVDFDPAADRLRVISSDGQNL